MLCLSSKNENNYVFSQTGGNKKAGQRSRATIFTSKEAILEGATSLFTTIVDSISISTTPRTTELPAEFVTMLCDQEIQVEISCHVNILVGVVYTGKVTCRRSRVKSFDSWKIMLSY